MVDLQKLMCYDSYTTCLIIVYFECLFQPKSKEVGYCYLSCYSATFYHDSNFVPLVG